jgi:hypothetical protein
LTPPICKLNSSRNSGSGSSRQAERSYDWLSPSRRSQSLQRPLPPAESRPVMHLKFFLSV